MLEAPGLLFINVCPHMELIYLAHQNEWLGECSALGEFTESHFEL